ncbi:xanthine dehydrogenase accessory protein XdhC [Hylemonella gracilis]|uniref:Xanthine dehydrogenase accessory protein XdhC n=1 Tax=Hylemonella gracilis TaxID=80880 RepID=A0A4V1A1Y3_9BURK|nr:xanthine dehydrogenase accessory protein XdhC [Hylemonella gracilis]QBK04149.1 xanthine dehydrogenase accessory protein XdhC [Hylemonella gracilis]
MVHLSNDAAMLVRVVRTEGSAPRDVGAWMLVEFVPTTGAADEFTAAGVKVTGTIGGGHLEFEAIAFARALLAGKTALPDKDQRKALGPSLGQCCGGVVWLRYELLDARDAQSQALRLRTAAAATLPVALFGGGHVGQALARLLAGLPFALHWIDSREGIFPADITAGAVRLRCEHSDPVHAAVRDLLPGSAVLIMSFSHAEDLDILAACLTRAREQNDLPYIGLIGSRSKWATFRHRLAARGWGEEDFARVTCPIGVGGIAGEFRKQPEVIAVAVAAQLLQLPGQASR